MKRIITAILCFFCCCIYAQDKKQIAADNEMLVTAASFFIEPGSLSGVDQPYDYPFDSIIFKDVRFDTVTIGASNRVGFLADKNKFTYIKPSGGLPGFLNELLNSSKTLHSNSTGGKLICYVKKFRITELDSAYEINSKKQRQIQIRSAIDVFYSYDNSMYPAFRTDTTFVQLLSENKTGYFIIDSLLRSFTGRATKIDKNKVLPRKAFSEAAIDSSYKRRFDLPVLNAGSFKKGVYTSAKEFFNNAPSIPDYEWRPDKKVNILYTKEQGNEWLVTRNNVFGFCDGTNIWLKVENSFYPAFRRQNTFECIAPLFLKRVVNNDPAIVYIPIGGYLIPLTFNSKHSSAYYKDKSVYQVDMETAEFY